MVQPDIALGDIAGVTSLDPLMLTEADLAVQTDGGTYRELFDRGDLINQHPWLGALACYLLLSIMGYCAFILAFFVFRGLRDRGYAISRVLGSLFVAYVVWLGGSLKFANGVPFLPNVASSFWMVFMLLLICSALVFYRRKRDILAWLQGNRSYVFGAEGLGLILFLVFLFVRFANPDLWHPAVGGEKPMDFAFFNAVLKSTSFPPYDPWFSGGYLNYYYFGFVWISQFAKMLGLLPSIAYNVAIPLIYSLTGLGIFGVVYTISPFRKGASMVGGGFAVAMALVFGNLGQPRFLFRYIRGFFDLPASHVRNLYWNATRIMTKAPGEITPITEMPVFTFLYGDLHAHMMAMPLAILALSVAISLAIRPSLVQLLFAAFSLGAVSIANMWDAPTYALILIAALVFGEFRGKQSAWIKIGQIAWKAGALLLLSRGLFWPFFSAFSSAYSGVELWQGARTSFSVYFQIYGVFLFLATSYLFFESRRFFKDWSISKWGVVGLVGIAVEILIFSVTKMPVAVVALPLIIWALFLFFWKGVKGHVSREIILFLIGFSLTITLGTEILRVHGDMGRMNTVFKFYLQVWLLLSIACGATLPIVWRYFSMPKRAWRGPLWQAGFLCLVSIALLYPLTAIPAKISERMSRSAPRTLDGLNYMKTAQHRENGQPIDFSHDYDAMVWIQDHISGSPVIVEAQVPEYRWGSRFSIITGLPTVLGWAHHERQGRSILPPRVINRRVSDIKRFYESPELEQARQFLRRYQVRYVIVGQLERAYYPAAGVDKFERMVSDGLLRTVYSQRMTTIYEVTLERN